MENLFWNDQCSLFHFKQSSVRKLLSEWKLHQLLGHTVPGNLAILCPQTRRNARPHVFLLSVLEVWYFMDIFTINNYSILCTEASKTCYSFFFIIWVHFVRTFLNFFGTLIAYLIRVRTELFEVKSGNLNSWSNSLCSKTLHLLLNDRNRESRTEIKIISLAIFANIIIDNEYPFTKL